jgi:fumarate hydratase class II
MSAKEEGFRAESDSMGEVRLPAWAYWGAQTQRAVENFGISALRIPPRLIEALGLIKRYAAEVNAELGLLEKGLARAIVQAADELIGGRWNEHFPIDVFQTGSGTSWNMNANELLANRANQLLGSPLGTRAPVHPNDHVNRGQSSNDVIPAAMHIADRRAAGALADELGRLADAFQLKAGSHRGVLKLGRTHLQDAVPMTVGQELSGYASQLRHALRRLEDAFPHLEELALGGTAIGTGLNAHAELAPRVIQRIAAHTGLPFRQADNLFEALACRDAQAGLMAALDTLAGSLLKISSDLRLLASGPRGGLGELRLPSLQPGSSIMPGKVNPVIPEMVAQAAVYVKGQALSVTLAAAQGPLELNMMMPLIAYQTQDCLGLLTRACRVFRERCVDGLEADAERCAHWIEWSLALVTPLATRIGYDRAAQIAYQAYREGKTVRQVALEQKVLEPAELEAVLDPRSMLGPDRS